MLRGVVEPPASSQGANKSLNKSPDYKPQLQDHGTLKSPDPFDWLEAAFGSRDPASSSNANCCRQNEENSVPEAANLQTFECSEAPQKVKELMPALFVRIEHEPPDNSLFDATGKMCTP